MTAAFIRETVLDVRHWTEDYFSFTTSRDDGFRFDNGQFVMIGLEVEGRPLLRAYSIASPAWDESLEFFSIKVPGGPLTERLANIKPGDEILMRPKTTGTLVNDALLPGKRLFMLSTGTGIAPFVSLIRDPETYEKFDTVIMMHTCREVAELEKDVQRTQREFDEDLLQRKSEERAAIAQKAFKLIEQIAEQEHLDVVLQESAWSSPRIDITDKVIKLLDK